jgi:hypothetical protein
VASGARRVGRWQRTCARNARGSFAPAVGGDALFVLGVNEARQLARGDADPRRSVRQLRRRGSSRARCLLARPSVIGSAIGRDLANPRGTEPTMSLSEVISPAVWVTGPRSQTKGFLTCHLSSIASQASAEARKVRAGFDRRSAASLAEPITARDAVAQTRTAARARDGSAENGGELPPSFARSSCPRADLRHPSSATVGRAAPAPHKLQAHAGSVGHGPPRPPNQGARTGERMPRLRDHAASCPLGGRTATRAWAYAMAGFRAGRGSV